MGNLLKRSPAEVNKLKLGSGFDEGVTLGPLISPKQRDRVRMYFRAHCTIKES